MGKKVCRKSTTFYKTHQNHQSHKIKIKYHYKFGVQVPLSTKQALILANKDHLWEETIMKEIKEIESSNTFIIQDSKENISNDLKFIPVYFIFDVKCDGIRKARLVVGVHLTYTDI